MNDEPEDEPAIAPADFANRVVVDGAPCPKCMGKCKYLQGDLFQCEGCGGIWTSLQILSGRES